MRHIVITGANSGIGFELCRQYVAKGDRVTAICRKSSPELDSLDANVIDQIDLSQDASYARLAEKLQGESIDILINNAGLYIVDSLEDFDPAAIRLQFEVNALAPLRVTAALLPNLGEGARIAMISSRMGSIADNSSGGSYGYRASKTALNMMAVSLAHDLKDRSIWVGILHPGYVRTKLTQMTGDLTSEESAAALIQRIESAKLKESGSFWHCNGERLPW